MTYKDIKNEIETYEENYRQAFYINGEHNRTEAKIKMLEDSFNARNAALSALFDVESMYSSKMKLDCESVEALISQFSQGIDDKIDKIKKSKDKNKKQKIQSMIDFKKIYIEIFENIIKLEQKEFLKVIEYALKKKKKINASEKRHIRFEDNNTINDVVNSLNKNYEKFTSDRLQRQNRVHHVGTSIEAIEAYRALITKEEIMYNLILNAIKDSLNACENNENINKELVLSNFSVHETYPDNRDLYSDEEAYDMSHNGFDLYKKTYEAVYILSKKAKKKLCKKLKDKLQ